MKTLKKIGLTCLLGLSLVTVNAKNNPLRKNTESVSKKIQASVSLPKEFKTSGFSEKVKIVFTVDENGNVKQNVAQTTNRVLKTSVETQFKKICFTGLSPETSYSVEIKFIVQ